MFFYQVVLFCSIDKAIYVIENTFRLTDTKLSEMIVRLKSVMPNVSNTNNTIISIGNAYFHLSHVMCHMFIVICHRVQRNRTHLTAHTAKGNVL